MCENTKEDKVAELVEKLEELNEKHSPDYEESHFEADRLLLEFINDERVTKAFDSVHKWYS